jgi:hypothetical protein
MLVTTWFPLTIVESKLPAHITQLVTFWRLGPVMIASAERIVTLSPNARELILIETFILFG